MVRHQSSAEVASAGAASPDPNAKSKEPEFEPIQITIEYDLRNPKDGIHVVKPSDLYPNVSTPSSTDITACVNLLAYLLRSAYLTAILQATLLTQQDAGYLA